MSHDLSIKGSLQLEPGTTLGQVLTIFAPFLVSDAVSVDVPPAGTVPPAGVMELSERGCRFELTVTGELLLDIDADGEGVPQGMEPVMQALSDLCSQGGHIEFIDCDMSPTNEEHLTVMFLGVDERAKRSGQVRYGMAKARRWLADIVEPRTLDLMEAMGLEDADAL